ncbi:MAG TPA: heavy metal-associated domain-containing protein [Sporichthyaceae bacterium]|jgi:copper chaperone CopZ|nr:heavy metal-associated domain-containing protein [Sporichthyaceae bacterium]
MTTAQQGQQVFTATGTVAGMSCGHCVASVTEEVKGLPGVQQVEVELASGRLSVLADRAVDPDALRAAVVEAGFTFTAGPVQ